MEPAEGHGRGSVTGWRWNPGGPQDWSWREGDGGISEAQSAVKEMPALVSLGVPEDRSQGGPSLGLGHLGGDRTGLDPREVCGLRSHGVSEAEPCSALRL